VGAGRGGTLGEGLAVRGGVEDQAAQRVLLERQVDGGRPAPPCGAAFSTARAHTPLLTSTETNRSTARGWNAAARATGRARRAQRRAEPLEQRGGLAVVVRGRAELAAPPAEHAERRETLGELGDVRQACTAGRAPVSTAP
jgi:hypothetical protein